LKDEVVLVDESKLSRLLEAEFEAKIELASGRGTVLIKASD
jgi:hypothetical protein